MLVWGRNELFEILHVLAVEQSTNPKDYVHASFRRPRGYRLFRIQFFFCVPSIVNSKLDRKWNLLHPPSSLYILQIAAQTFAIHYYSNTHPLV